jgi:hypothetical protein
LAELKNGVIENKRFEKSVNILEIIKRVQPNAESILMINPVFSSRSMKWARVLS